MAPAGMWSVAPKISGLGVGGGSSSSMQGHASVPPPRPERVACEDSLKGMFMDVRRRLCREGRHVTCCAVVDTMCREVGMTMDELRAQLGLRASQQLQCVRDMWDSERFVNAFIASFTEARCIATLWELEQALAADKQFESFEQYWLGPLHKHPREWPPVPCVDAACVEAACVEAACVDAMARCRVWMP
eukprot:364081-Chlamydomonas_euryale.AAC.6